MNHRDFFVKTIIVVLILLIAACSAQPTSEPVLITTETVTPVPPTETPTSTPTPEPTSTPTIAPTPIGGKNGLLLSRNVCPQEGDCIPTIFLYNLVSHELNSFLDGYTAVDVSPDGKNILLKNVKDAWETGDLFILDLAKPEQVIPFQQNVDDAVWLGDSGWIGFITTVNGGRQVFLVHPDGSNLTQVTNSSMGAVTLEPVFNDGIFWGEGTIAGDGSRYIDSYKWTRLDGTETRLINFRSVSPDGKYGITRSMSGMGSELLDITTSKTREISLSKPAPAIDFSPIIQPLSDDKWLIANGGASDTDPYYFIYSPEGNLLAELPSEYEIVNSSAPPPPYRLLSSDGIWILVGKTVKISDEQFKVTYHLFNTTTSEIQELPNLFYTDTREFMASPRHQYFWVEIP